jgi:putative CocE/NonD family hydrolase
MNQVTKSIAPWRRVSALVSLAVLLGAPAPPVRAQDLKQRKAAAVAYITEHADREDMVMMPMHYGVRLYTLILFPKGQPRQNLPAVLFRHPYLTDSMVDRFAEYEASLLANGYAVVFQNERGRYFSEGTYTYLAGSGEDGYDTVQWLAKQAWSNGKVGTLGCSSSAEEQHKLQGLRPPGLAAVVPMGSGAGIGKVGPYNEMGNFYRGGAVQMFWFSWYYDAGYTYRPLFPASLSRAQMLRLERFWNLQPEHVPPSGIDTAVWTLPLNKIMDTMGGVPSDLDDFVKRLPNDPRWREVDFGGEGDRAGAPMLMINSWYDISVGPNVAMYEYQSKNAANETARNNMFMVIAPTTHCEEGRMESEHTVVGQRDMGDARLDYAGLVQKWFDHFLKGADNGVTSQPKVRAFMMGANQWRAYDTWPPKEAESISYYLDSGGKANTAYGDGRLSATRPTKAGLDTLIYDPLRPVPSLGGSICCFSPNFVGGAFDQSATEMRSDVLVYSTPPLANAMELAGPVKVSLYLSSDRRDTDLTVKLLDVYLDGKAYNLDENIHRVRWRARWDKPVFMEPGHVYKVDVGPLVTSNAFLPGHEIRIEVSSSNFPRFERNLNTGGNNFDEKDGLVAHNVIHHGPDYPSVVVLPVVNARDLAKSRSKE